MTRDAPLRVTVEIDLKDGPAAGRRRFRLSHRIELPPTLFFSVGLPIEGQAQSEVSFVLPNGISIRSDATLYYDPQHPELGASAVLLRLDSTTLYHLETYIEQRLQQ